MNNQKMDNSQSTGERILAFIKKGQVSSLKKLGIGFLVVVSLVIITAVITNRYFNDETYLWKQEYKELKIEQTELNKLIKNYKEKSVSIQDSVIKYKIKYQTADSLEKIAINKLSKIKNRYEKINIELSNYTANEHIELFTGETDSANNYQ